MSRTNRGSKGWNYEYWSPRLGNKGWPIPGRQQKKETSSRERMAEKQLVREEFEDFDNPEPFETKCKGCGLFSYPEELVGANSCWACAYD